MRAKKHGAEIVGDKTAVLENKSETETMDVLLLQGDRLANRWRRTDRSL